MNHNRMLVASLCLGFSSLAFCQLESKDLDVKVNLKANAMPVARVLDELTAQTQVQLKIGNNVNREIVIVNVKDVTLRDLMAQLAKVTRCNWRLADSGYELILGPAGTEEAIDKTEALRKEIAERLNAMRKRTSQPNDPEEMEMAGMADMMGMSGAGSIAILQLLSAQPIAQIANMDKGTRLVFSSSPTRMQLPMRGNAQAIITTLINEHNKAMAQRSTTPNEIPEEVQPYMDFLKQFGVFDEPKQIDGRAAKALLIVESGSGFMSMKSCTLKLYDGNGKVLFQATDTLSMSGFMGMSRPNMDMEEEEEVEAPAVAGTAKPTKDKKQEDKQPGDDKPITMSAETKELMQLISGGFQMAMSQTRPSQGLETKLLNPDLYDPLSFFASDALTSSAAIRGLNLVACVPDSFGNTFSFMGMGAGAGSTNYTSATIRKMVEGDEDLKQTVADKWWTIQPKYHSQARRERMDRPALAKLLKSSKSKGMLTLDDLADYAMVNDSPMETPIAMTHIMLYAPTALGRGMAGMNDWRLLRFYGTLGPAQRSMARKGTTMDFRQFSLPQQRAASAILFGAGTSIEVGPPPPNENDFDRMMRSMMGQFMPQKSASWKQEPTEVMPNGLPQNGLLTITVQSDPCGVPVESGNEMLDSMGAIGPWELAMLNLMKETPGFAEMAGAMPEIPKLRMGERSTFNFIFTVDPEARVNRMLTDDAIPANGPIIDLNNPPADFKERIDKASAMIKNSPFFKMMTGFGQRSGSPAPPNN